MKKQISDKIINRLTLYHCILNDFIDNGEEFISSGQIAQLLKIDASQVRKDINILNNSGKSRVGYKTKDLKKSIETTLGFSNTKKAYIVGAGNLGVALANYGNFSNYGFNIIALFDNDTNKIGKEINNKKILDIKELPQYVWRHYADIAILTVPAKNAQSCAEFLVKAGTKYIWNFTPKILKVPDNVQVWNENLMGNFLQFTYDLN